MSLPSNSQPRAVPSPRKGLRFLRYFTAQGDSLASVRWSSRTSRVTEPDHG